MPSMPTASLALILTLALIITGCAAPQPKRIDDACSIFKENPSWVKHTRRAAKKWKASASVLLAIMRQESAFKANAKPKRRRFLGIPLSRPSTAFGYPQALDTTWSVYKKDTNSVFAQRDSFKDAMDFIGWYVTQTRKRLKISPADGYRQYLAYHEGWNGYAQGTHRQKKWLKSVAKKVATQAKNYRAQLKSCGYRPS